MAACQGGGSRCVRWPCLRPCWSCWLSARAPHVPALMAAFRRGIGDDFVQAALLHRSRIPLIRVLFLPLISYRPDVRRFHNLRYGDARRGHLLDVYASRHPPQGAPVLIYLHGGGFLIGSKMLGAAAAAVPPREPRLGMCERELPPFATRLVRRPSDRRQAGDRLGPRARSGVRRRPADCDPGRRVGRRAPGSDRCTHRRRRAVPARLRSGGHIGVGGGRDVWLLRPHRQRGQCSELPACVPSPGPHRSSSSMGRSTRSCSSRTRATSPMSWRGHPTSPLCTPSFRARSTTSTSSTRCAFTRSPMPSSRS